MPSFLSGQPDPVNTKITVSVADLAVAPAAPFIVFARPKRSGGRSRRPAGMPYVVAAKFVVNQVESAADIKKLAKQIVDTILTNKAVVEEKAKALTSSNGPATGKTAHRFSSDASTRASAPPGAPAEAGSSVAVSGSRSEAWRASRGTAPFRPVRLRLGRRDRGAPARPPPRSARTAPARRLPLYRNVTGRSRSSSLLASAMSSTFSL